MPAPFAGQTRAGDTVQFLVDERNEPLQGGFVPVVPCQQQPGEITGRDRDGRILRPLSPIPVLPSISRLY